MAPCGLSLPGLTAVSSAHGRGAAVSSVSFLIRRVRETLASASAKRPSRRHRDDEPTIKYTQLPSPK